MVNLRGIVGQVLQPQAELISRLEDSLAVEHDHLTRRSAQPRRAQSAAANPADARGRFDGCRFSRCCRHWFADLKLSKIPPFLLFFLPCQNRAHETSGLGAFRYPIDLFVQLATTLEDFFLILSFFCIDR